VGDELEVRILYESTCGSPDTCVFPSISGKALMPVGAYFDPERLAG
jgi:hypothetical protein